MISHDLGAFEIISKMVCASSGYSYDSSTYPLKNTMLTSIYNSVAIYVLGGSVPVSSYINIIPPFSGNLSCFL